MLLNSKEALERAGGTCRDLWVPTGRDAAIPWAQQEESDKAIIHRGEVSRRWRRRMVTSHEPSALASLRGQGGLMARTGAESGSSRPWQETVTADGSLLVPPMAKLHLTPLSKRVVTRGNLRLRAEGGM